MATARLINSAIWVLDPLRAWRTVPRTSPVAGEGGTSSRREVADRLTYAVWVDAPREVRLRRGVDRDGEHMRSRRLSWMDRENGFFSEDGTRERAQLRVNGDPVVNIEGD